MKAAGDTCTRKYSASKPSTFSSVLSSVQSGGRPEGRYAGAAKVVGNIEIRIPFPRFTLFKQRFRLGTTTFFDAGRVWAS